MSDLPYNKNLVGPLIARGGEHSVYHYDKKYVIKFPFGPRYWLNAEKFCANLARDEEIVREYFGDYLVQREIKFYSNGRPSYVIIEPKITGRHLQKQDLKNFGLLSDFKNLIAINNKMAEHENLSAELFGIKKLIFDGKTEVANIILEKYTNKLFLIDAGIMHFGRHKDQQILIDTVTKWAMRKQERLLKYYLEN